MSSKKHASFQAWHAIFFFGILLVALSLGIVNRFSVSGPSAPVQSILTKSTCETAGGEWNECASACRGNEDAACIQVCVEACECKADSDCPFGFSCKDMIEGTGICSDS